jgi:hypothetical protein
MPGRASPGPALLRALLLEAARGPGMDVTLMRLGPFASFQALTALWQAGWLGGGQSSARASSAEIRQRLRAIGEARRTAAEAMEAPVGEPLLVGGVLASLASPVLCDETGAVVRVALEGAHHVGRPAPLTEGDRVTVLGFADRELAADEAPGGPRRLPYRVIVRAAHLPVVVHMAAAGKAAVGTIPSDDERGA